MEPEKPLAKGRFQKNDAHLYPSERQRGFWCVYKWQSAQEFQKNGDSNHYFNFPMSPSPVIPTQQKKHGIPIPPKLLILLIVHPVARTKGGGEEDRQATSEALWGTDHQNSQYSRYWPNDHLSSYQLSWANHTLRKPGHHCWFILAWGFNFKSLRWQWQGWLGEGCPEQGLLWGRVVPVAQWGLGWGTVEALGLAPSWMETWVLPWCLLWWNESVSWIQSFWLGSILRWKKDTCPPPRQFSYSRLLAVTSIPCIYRRGARCAGTAPASQYRWCGWWVWGDTRESRVCQNWRAGKADWARRRTRWQDKPCKDPCPWPEPTREHDKSCRNQGSRPEPTSRESDRCRSRDPGSWPKQARSRQYPSSCREPGSRPKQARSKHKCNPWKGWGRRPEQERHTGYHFRRSRRRGGWDRRREGETGRSGKKKERCARALHALLSQHQKSIS